LAAAEKDPRVQPQAASTKAQAASNKRQAQKTA